MTWGSTSSDAWASCRAVVKSFAGLRREIADVAARLDVGEAVAETLPHRRKYLRLNARLGLYTNFVNLLDLAAVAVPMSFRRDGLPAGFTFIGPRDSDARLGALVHIGKAILFPEALEIAEGRSQHPGTATLQFTSLKQFGGLN